MARALLVVAAAALIGAAAAQLECTAYDGSVLSVSARGTTCYTASGTGEDAPEILFDLTPADMESGAFLWVWNGGEDADFMSAGQTPELDGYKPDVNGVPNGWDLDGPWSGEMTAATDEDPAVNAVWGFRYETQDARVGRHTFSLDSAETFHFMLVSQKYGASGKPAAALTVGGTVTATAQSINGGWLEFEIDAPAFNNRYMVDSLTVSHTPAALSYVSTSGPWDANMFVGTDEDGEDLEAGTVQFTEIEFNSRPHDNSFVSFYVETYDINVDFDWGIGPYTDVSLTLDSITEYPTLTNGVWKSVVATDEAQFFQIDHDTHWAKVEVFTSLFVEGGDPEDGASTAENYIVQLGDTSDGNAMRTNSFNTELAYVNQNWDISDPTDYSALLSSAKQNFQGKFVVKVKQGEDVGYTPPALNIKVVITQLGGECSTGYEACNKLEDDHPSSKKATSANEAGSRMRHCIVMPSADDLLMPTTRCAECTASCDCGAGQYCHLDNGICYTGSDYNSGDSVYAVCSGESYRKYGICIDKDPADAIIGQSCRTDVGAIADDARDLFQDLDRSDRLPLVAESASAALAVEGGITGNGFCGKAVYYNNTPPAGAPWQDGRDEASPANVARRILWSGKCVNHVCQECDQGSSTCNGNLQCIQGRWEERIVVDGTARTFNENTLAGLGLATVLMIVLLQLCTCVRIFQAYRQVHPKVNASDKAGFKKVAA
uniref:Uncharacterized protein n=1 Tax=Bicosoecida sp. CB-2014 TaxID=1486930 RepID=A0A7S1GEC1_9STRA|eukprot:CAMPEP_0203806886 /NCGR_PEP_ID=MMETSP0115-20131106/759_1 /ASSEMBLY_ACC=CAM_ASM_000227 /TAXON_ID=33651 /ORGANISM="Bicosoecid sp, Strain ms1" /LENGTH=716 /DNA_ID=CAMNT_0050715553 /DNA_START=38 /DNA_END=2188 /DNA_ORIENTATION=+